MTSSLKNEKKKFFFFRETPKFSYRLNKIIIIIHLSVKVRIIPFELRRIPFELRRIPFSNEYILFYLEGIYFL